jgi:hypothetical protein
MSELEVEKRGAQLSLLQVTCRFHEVCSLAFLAGVPRVAGVYRFHGRRQKRSKDVEVLYVGKAIDLRRRLASYRSDHPSNRSRKTRRLLARVEFISWEECGSELEALLLENRLIQELRPAFNRAQVWPQGYWYYGLECGGGGVVLRLGHEVGGEGEWFGAFRSRRAFAALGRVMRGVGSGWRVRPSARWFEHDTPRELRLGLGEGGGAGDLVEVLRLYLAGEEDVFLRRVMESLEGGVVLSAFDRSWVTEDLEVLRVFYERVARRNRVWSERMAYGGGLVPKEAVDAMILREGMEGGQGPAGLVARPEASELI